MSRINVVISHAMILLGATSAAAAGGGGGHHEPHIENVWGLGEKYSETPALGWLAITFAIFVYGVIRFAGPAIKGHMTTRADTIEKAMAEAQQARADAERRANEAEAKLAALAGDVARMQADFEAQGKLEGARIQQAAEDMAKKIARDAEETILAETARAREALRAEAASLALQVAEVRIKQMLSVADDQKLTKSLITELSA